MKKRIFAALAPLIRPAVDPIRSTLELAPEAELNGLALFLYPKTTPKSPPMRALALARSSLARRPPSAILLGIARSHATATASTAIADGASGPLPFSAMPRLPTYPLVGSIPYIASLDPTGSKMKGMHEVMAKIALLPPTDGGSVVRWRSPAYGQDGLIVSDPEAALDVYRNEAREPHRTTMPSWTLYREEKGITKGVALSQGEEWRRLRFAANDLIFKPQIVHSKFTQGLASPTTQLMDVIESHMRASGPDALSGHQRLALEDTVMRWSIEAVSSVVLARPMGALNADGTGTNPLTARMIKSFTALLQSTGPIIYLPEWTWRNPTIRQFVPVARDHWRDLEEFHTVCEELVSGTLAELAAKPGALEGSFFGMLLARDQNLTRDEMYSFANDFMNAGIDTTSRSALHTTYLLGQYPAVQEKLRAEVLEVVGPEPNGVEVSHLPKLKYMRNVIKESMRMIPVAALNGRRVTRPTVIGGYEIPAGTEIIINHYGMSHNPRHVANPAVFDPERWDSDSAPHGGVSNPFGYGARMCIGRRIAELELTVFFANLVRRFQVEPSPEPLNLYMQLLLGNAEPMPIRLSVRDNKPL
ncbi:cytochrome P450 [Blastocladiella britannica]|nr:cytochrome P450 [Blastocladiella britannica]